MLQKNEKIVLLVAPVRPNMLNMPKPASGSYNVLIR